MLGNGSCNDACYTSNCNYDQGDCVSKYCTSGCYPDDLKNQVCNSECNVAACDYDGKDCQCAPACSQDMLSNDVCDSDCEDKDKCKFDNYKCVSCT
jgi:Notch-like protein